ncbi:hypothetical protein [uncultured Corynebacterium sp.]|uniref:hypothetical protein n=1 Tax=uncultured Corynebacterium sp. TaxID=159447 RepID=UPI0025FCB719|nr:hypothetical protein [uncultured Corynebacterium sp.]
MRSVTEGKTEVFEAKTPTELRIIPFVILIPSMVGILAAPVWQVIVPIVAVLLLLVWASFTARVSVRVGKDAVEVRGPFYRRTIPVAKFAEVTVHREGAADHSWLNWPVVGRATSPAGVRMSLSGTVGARIRTTAGEKYTVFLATPAEAEACVAAVKALLPSPAEP